MSSITGNPIVLKNVRIAFVNLFTKAKFQGKETGYSLTLLVPKDDPQMKEVKTEFQRLIDEASQAAGGKRKIKITEDKSCVRDGDEQDHLTGFPGNYSIRVSNKNAPNTPGGPYVANRANQETNDDRLFYPGARVNAKITLWFQDNDYGKRVNGNLLGIQFYQDDESFVSNRGATAEDFESYEAPSAEASDSELPEPEVDHGTEDDNADMPF